MEYVCKNRDFMRVFGWEGIYGKIDVRGPYLIITLLQTNIFLRIFTQIKKKDSENISFTICYVFYNINDFIYL